MRRAAIYAAFLVEEEGIASTFQALPEVFKAHGHAAQVWRQS
jgi:hypothetical protein